MFSNSLGSIFITCVVLFCSACIQQQQAPPETIDPSAEFGMTTELVIGREDQPDAYQLGEPEAVRTDRQGRIYVTDAARLAVKVFGADGSYLRTIGRRGRGPAEFLEINLMGLTPEGHLAFFDRYNVRYSILSKQGESLEAFPIDLANQYYPRTLASVDDHSIGLYLSSSTSSSSTLFENKLFHVYGENLKNKKYSFGPFNRLGYEKITAWVQFSAHTGSFLVTDDNRTLIYSPGIYDGTLYVYRRPEGGTLDVRPYYPGSTA